METTGIHSQGMTAAGGEGEWHHTFPGSLRVGCGESARTEGSPEGRKRSTASLLVFIWSGKDKNKIPL